MFPRGAVYADFRRQTGVPGREPGNGVFCQALSVGEGDIFRLGTRRVRKVGEAKTKIYDDARKKVTDE